MPTPLEVHAVPQRQGALVPRAAGIPAGCRALAALAATVLGAELRPVPVAGPDETSPTVDGVANAALLRTNRVAQTLALRVAPGPVLTVGGDCSVELAPVQHARRRHGPDLAALWFDAHADLNTPGSSPSGALHGMALRAAFGDGVPGQVAEPALRHWRAVLAGTRALDPAEAELVGAGRAIGLLEPGGPPDALEPGPLYLHVDLDVLDPDEFPGATYPEPGGMSVAEVAAAIRALGPGWPVVGAGITECATDDPARLRALVPLLESIGTVLGAG